MAAAPLTSNHVNYLIWRYLQESGHDKTAARLQRDWKITDPETLPFARHIKTHALVSLVQKGLQYHELESSIHQNGDRATQTPTVLFFGTDAADAASSREVGDAGSLVKAPSSPRKHPRESINAAGGLDPTSQAPAAKRPRRAPRDAASSTNLAKSGNEMDLDQQDGPEDAELVNSDDGPGQDGPLPNGKVEHHDSGPGISPEGLASTAPTPSPPPVPTLDTGKSVPTQTDSVIEISKEITQLLETELTDSSKDAGALLTAWNPHQPNLLISGGDGLCRLFQWSVHYDNAPATNGSTLTGPAPHAHDLFDSMNGASITALTWNPDGQQVAVARHFYESQTASSISLFDNTGQFEGELSHSQLYFLGLAYSPSGTYLFGFGGANVHYEDGSRDWCLCIWDSSNPQETEPLTIRTAPRQEISGAAWLNDEAIIVCGPGFIARTRLVDGRLQDWQSVLPDATPDSSSRSHEWSMIASDQYSKTCILSAADQGLIGILGEDGRRITVRAAHDKPITGLQYQPLPQHGSTGDGPRLVASASEDGTVKLWDAANGLSLLKILQCDTLQPTLQPVLAMQFSPDGATLAAASYNKVSFWRPEKEGAWPSAEWTLNRSMGWKTIGSSSEDAASHQGETETNGVANGVNGHSKSNGTNGTIANEGVQADHMSIDGEEDRSHDWDLDEESPATTLVWSAMGKKVAFGSRNQIAIADFTKAQL